MARVNPSTPPSEAERAIPSSRYSLPLYDPHGLGSPSNDDLSNAHTLQSHQQDGLLPPSNAVPGPVTPLMDQALRPGRRGRRRRSSEYAHTNRDLGSGESSSNEEVGTSDNKGGEPLRWWQRSKQRSDKVQSEQGDENAKARHPALAPLETKGTPQASSSPSLSVKSPAAAFLSSMNESLGSPSSHSGSILENERGYSVSPIRNGSQSYRLSMPLMSSFHASDESTAGLASVASQMFGAANVSQSRSESTSIRPDEEGATIGPDGRYLLGKTIGFGGFSTIREAWDLGSGAEKRGMASRENMHRIAVKIVYSTDQDGLVDAAREDEELQIWNTIPAHPNLLPLLHYERVVTDQNVSGASKTQAISFLVMPYCEGSLLAYVKSEGTLPENASSSSPSIQSLSRGGSLRSTKTPLQHYESSVRQQSAYTRTGSGFIPRSAGIRMASVPLSNVLGQSPSTPATASSTLLRRGSSRLSRAPQITNGVPFSAARKVMQQVTEALMCLHTKAGIVHGDLKLENVLGQRSVSTHTRRRSEHGRGRSDSDEEEGSMQDVLAASESICWRVADFGLARKVPSKGQARLSETHQHIADMQERAAMARKGKTTVGGAGGSLAYTAPETFLPNVSSVTAAEETDCSPFASDMWALGCILYALCSGKLPFSDSFEPRLQMKIAKGTWDMPLRLRRYKERKAPSAVSQASAATRRERSTSGYIAESMSRTSSLSSSFAAYKPPHPVSATTVPSTVVDMSASMPALQERHFFENSGMRSGSDQSIIDHDLLEASFTVEEREESSAESDEDEQIDREKDGTSRDRLSIRLILHKLLEPDPRKRWTIEQLASHAWISEAAPTPFLGMEEEIARRLSNAGDYPATQGFFGHSLSKRPSLAHPSISEHASQEATATYEEAGDGGNEDDHGRGRSVRREPAAGGTGPAKPIDIDRSSSRSHSRPRATRADSSPWEMASSSFERALQMAGPWEQAPSRRQLQRSTSADTHEAMRGASSPSKERRSASRPPRLDAVKAESRGSGERSPAPPTSTSSRGSDGSASRSSTSRSRSRARDTLYEIVSRTEPKEASDDRLWWQRGRKSAR